MFKKINGVEDHDVLDLWFRIAEVIDIDLLWFTLKERCSDGVPSSEGDNLGRVEGSSDQR